MTANIIPFYSRAEANRILNAKVVEIRANHPDLPEDDQIDIMADFIANADPQLQREADRQFFETEK
jgi:hypothetical protein